MSDKRIKKIPYGLADYERFVRDNCYYVDKTIYLKAIEEAGDYLFFIRPRRFGKSLFLSVMEAYYDVFYKDRFAELFKETVIYKQPTKEKGVYLVLKFNFSTVDPNVEKVEASFLNHVRVTALSFMSKYAGYFPGFTGHYKKIIEETRSASDILSAITGLCRESNQKSYAIIDEYDNFANTILSTSGGGAYRELTHGAGFFRSFFNVLKGGTDGMGAPFTRLFLTGVSPITLDDVTSGFNIGKNVSGDAALNKMLGFTETDVIEMIEYYRAAGKIEHDSDYLLEIMRQWYNNYAFSTAAAAERETLFNSDMVLYFLDEYFKNPGVPDDLIDRNVRMDYGKLRHLITVDRSGKKETNGNFSRLREIVEDGEVTAKLRKGFPLEEIESTENFTSLLFYLGLLTIKGKKEGLPLFKMPNQTVKTLYYDYIVRVSRETGLLDINIGKIGSLLHDMAYHGNWQAFFDYLTGKMKESTSLRDFIREEKVIQGFLLAYLGLSDYFVVHSEKELNGGYADIVMEPFLAGYEGIKYSYIIEIKYMKKADRKPGSGNREKEKEKVEQLKKEAELQLGRYSGDKRFERTIGKTKLIKLALVFCGSELRHIGPA
ncbi:MAG: AAA family ATPase [Candidatus Aminicenantes bacterium]|nr:AAA family ATPase [Candidatus Aminicenantes bacterium]